MTPEQWAEIQDRDEASEGEWPNLPTIKAAFADRRLLLAHVREMEAERAETTKEVSRYQHACELGANRITALQAQLDLVEVIGSQGYWWDRLKTCSSCGELFLPKMKTQSLCDKHRAPSAQQGGAS